MCRIFVLTPDDIKTRFNIYDETLKLLVNCNVSSQALPITVLSDSHNILEFTE
ncbi:MAG: hypothetical protein H7196_01810 [candidate division SR1 bacterium]|nr:hypothetical protein [candidate division SR1 bacterium]